MRARLLTASLVLMAAASAHAADPAISFREAWSPAAEKGADTNLYMLIDNFGPEDAITRVRCDAANFTELRTIDKGEGFPSARAVKLIPIAAQSKLALHADGLNIHLLQLTGPLVPGATFDCTLRLRGGAQPKIAVTVRPADEKPE